MKILVKKINDWTITIVLVPVYFIGIGLSYLLFKIMTKRKPNKSTFWLKENLPQDKNYFYQTY